MALLALASCARSVDSLGYDSVDGSQGRTDAGPDAPGDGGTGGTAPMETGLRPLTAPSAYPNPFRDLLGKTEAEISRRLDAAFAQLFHGNPDNAAIYYPVAGTDQALIRDIFHGDVRTEGIGYAMLVCVQFDRRDEFDRLWRYARAVKASRGAAAGYFDSFCDVAVGPPVSCIDPFGYQQFTMALIFAHGRWGSDSTLDYEADALSLLDVMRNKEQKNGGIVDDVTNTIDGETKLVFDEPKVSSAAFTRPSLEMPAYYELWAQATGDDFWRLAAAAGRAFLDRVAHPTTGLTPVRAYFDGMPKEGGRSFNTEAYRTHLNLTLDVIWSGSTGFALDASNRLLTFFAERGPNGVGTSYELDGTPINPARDMALVYANGMLGASATVSERTAFVQAVWDAATPPLGPARYYAGLLDLLSLLVLSGRMQVY